MPTQMKGTSVYVNAVTLGKPLSLRGGLPGEPIRVIRVGTFSPTPKLQSEESSWRLS